MGKGHCKEGCELYEMFQRASEALLAADCEKRGLDGSSAAAAASAQRMEQVRLMFERVRSGYIEHVVRCTECEWEQLAQGYLEELERLAMELKVEPLFASMD